MEKEKILFLTKGKWDYVISGRYYDDVWALPVYRSDHLLCKAFARILSGRSIKLASFFLGNWASHIEDYDVIICEGLLGRKWVFEYLKKITKNHKCRIIMWHWNRIFEYEIDPHSQWGKDFEQWSFDENDCVTYGMNYNTQYFGTLPLSGNNVACEWDVYFVGADKGRKQHLEEFLEKCQSVELTAYLHVVADSKERTESNGQIPYRQPLSYMDNLENDAKARAILDIPQDGQTGLTLRTLEALYLQKKLITSNKSVKNLSFYNDNNILIYDDNTSGEEIRDFLESSYHETQQNADARNYYSFVSWARRFERTENT